MSAYPPPTENTPVFNTLYFSTASQASIATLSKYFLTFPLAQGTEYFNNASFSSAPVCSATQTYPSSATTNLATIGYVNQAIGGNEDSLIITTQPSNPYQITQLYQFIAIGGTPYQSWASGTYYLPYSTSLTWYSGLQIIIRNNTSNAVTIAVYPSSVQLIAINSYNGATPTQSSIALSAGTSTTLVFLASGTSGAGIWYVV